MRCVHRTFTCSFLNLWLVIYTLGLVWHERALVLVPAIFAALAALGMQRWSTPLVDYGFAGGARVVHTVIVGAVFALAVLGLAATSTGLAHGWDCGPHLRDAPLAVFFLLVGVFAWRALVRPHPRRTVAIAVFIYVAWIPFVAWNALQALGNAPGTDWQLTASRGALWALLGAGGLVCWLATLAAPRTIELAVARRV